MGLLGPKKAELTVVLEKNSAKDAESLLILLRGDEARGMLAARGWEENPRPVRANVTAAGRDYVYDVMMIPEATISYSTVNAMKMARVTLRGDKDSLHEGAAALAEIEGLAQEAFGDQISTRRGGAKPTV